MCLKICILIITRTGISCFRSNKCIISQFINSLLFPIGGNEENDSGVHDTLSKNDSLLSSSQQNDSAYPYEDSSEDSTDRSIYAPVKLRHPKTSQVIKFRHYILYNSKLTSFFCPTQKI